jgi:hypothetical protein
MTHHRPFGKGNLKHFPERTWFQAVGLVLAGRPFRYLWDFGQVTYL